MFHHWQTYLATQAHRRAHSDDTMKRLVFILLSSFIIVMLVTGTCIKQSQTSLMCINELQFNKIYPRIKSLELVNSFIAHPRRTFPLLESVIVQASKWKAEQCRVLMKSDYVVTGCNGKYVLISFAIGFRDSTRKTAYVMNHH